MSLHRYRENYNLNNCKSSWTSFVTVRTPNGSTVNIRRRKIDKLMALQECARSGVEENLSAVCKNCGIASREVVRKLPTNPHYGCYEECCSMLHQWDLCIQCIETKYFPCRIDDSDRRADAAKFQRVFSRLPDELQRVVEEYVPQVFALVRLQGRVLIDRSFEKIQRGVRLPRAIWNQIMEEMEGSGIRTPIGGYTLKRLSREALFMVLRGEYKKMYSVHRFHVIDDEDFWSHWKYGRMFFRLKAANMFNKVSAIVCAGK